MKHEFKRKSLNELNLTSRFLFDIVMEDEKIHQALLDTSLLEPGIPNYNVLNTSYIIVIMSFDLFGYGKYQYTFLPQCREVPGFQLEDGATRIFLNTEGKNEDEVSEELVEFLHYVKNSTDEVAASSQSKRVRRLHQRVCKVKASEEVGVRYMQAWEERYYDREKGRNEGIAEGRRKGKLEAKLEDALNMRKEGLSDEMIMRITKLTEEELKKITE